MPSLAEGAYPLSTLGFHTGADWACSLDLKSTSEFPMQHGRTLPIACGGVQATPAWTIPILLSSSLIALASEVCM